MRGQDVVFSSEKQDYCTPEVVLAPIRRVGPIVLDPCSNPRSIVRARRELSLENGDDGLMMDWSALACPSSIDAARGQHGLTFVNPPYDESDAWVAKCRLEGMRGCDTVGLIGARTDTARFHRHVFPAASAICFWRGRIQFIGGAAGAGFPSALVYWGERYVNEFCEQLAPHGAIWRLR